MKATPFNARNLVIASVLAATGAFAVAQAVPPAAPAAPAANAERAGPPHRGERMGQPGQRPVDRAEFAKKMGERHAQRQAEFKTRLQLTTQQDAAWAAFTGSMKPPATRPERLDREAFAKLTTPQRLDRMQQLKTQRDAEMAKRADATRTFYAQLSPSQQKVFDLETARGHGAKGGRGGPGHKGHGGPDGHRAPMRG